MHCRERRPAPNLTDCPRHGDHLDPPCAGAPERRRACVRSRARRVDVVHDADAQRGQPHRYDARADVAAALGEREPALPRQRPRALEEIGAGCPTWPRAPARGRVAGRHPASTPAPGLPERTRASTSGFGTTSPTSAAACSASLSVPAPSTPARAFVLARRRRWPSGTGELEPAAGALRAPHDGPRPGRAAALADRRPQPDERAPAVGTESPARATTDGAALRQEQLQHVVIVDDYPPRLCEKMRSASARVSADPMSYQSPGSTQT